MFVTIAIVWLAALLSKRIGKFRLSIGYIVSVVIAVVIVWNSYLAVSSQIGVAEFVKVFETIGS